MSDSRRKSARMNSHLLIDEAFAIFVMLSYMHLLAMYITFSVLYSLCSGNVFESSLHTLFALYMCSLSVAG